MTNVFLGNNGYTYRGEYVNAFSTGEVSSYSENDLVLFEGKLFVASKYIRGLSPDISSDWVPWGGSRVSYRSNVPPNPQIGDGWLNTNTGRFYTFVEDEDSKQWVEL
tara:strand:- start:102 stop:422 length:321 start_codon:yes stop_codon:yes gene_type:complete